ncbi:MAG: RIO1 family regulatory kinase/ATPase [Caldilineaceae bacterium]
MSSTESSNGFLQQNTHAQPYSATTGTQFDDDEYDALARHFGVADEVDNEGVWRTPGRKAKKKPAEIARELAAGPESIDDRFEITYTPARYEAIWLNDSLRPFAERALIDDVLALVKGGKEANVYMCRATAATGQPAGGEADARLVAAKVYRPRAFRNLRNDKMYREGRELLNDKGIAIKARDNREMRAIGKKTDFGQELTHISWLMHEFVTMQRLHAAGADVPAVLASGPNAILMEFVGDRRQAAPVLHGVSLEPGEARRLFHQVMRNIDKMLSLRMIHGDLSAYNILYWQGRITLIDFPQVTFAEANSNAWKILQRDVQRVCDYFAAQGVESDPQQLARRMWDQHIGLPTTGEVHTITHLRG